MKRAPLSDQDVADLCASFQEAAADVVSDRTRRAMELYADALGNDAQRLSSSPAASPPISACAQRSPKSPPNKASP